MLRLGLWPGMLTVPAPIYILVASRSKVRINCAVQSSPGFVAVCKIRPQACRHRGGAWISSQDVFGMRCCQKRFEQQTTVAANVIDAFAECMTAVR
jgi:hypothetical protein